MAAYKISALKFFRRAKKLEPHFCEVSASFENK